MTEMTPEEWRAWFEGRLPETSSTSQTEATRWEREGKSPFTGCPTWKRGQTTGESDIRITQRTPRPGPPEGQDYFSLFEKHGRPRGRFEDR